LALERNPYFCGDFPGNVARVEYRFSDRVDVTLDTFLQDGADLWLDEAGLQAGPGLRMREELPRTHWQARPGLATLYCGLMPNAPPLDDVRVRQALFMAIDRQALAEVMASSPNVPARGGFIPPGIPGHSPELSLPYDPQGARQRLREAGYAGGAELPPLHCVVFMPNPAIESMIVQWERTLGLTVLREEMTLGELMTRQDSHPPHIVLMAWLADYPDPHNFMDGGFVQQAVWHDERYHSMLEEASQTRDVRRRMALYHALDRQLVVEQALCLPLGHPRQMALVQPRVRNFKIMPSAHLLLRDVVLGAD
jgi:ABC-type transport system substrate-binding protein